MRASSSRTLALLILLLITAIYVVVSSLQALRCHGGQGTLCWLSSTRGTSTARLPAHQSGHGPAASKAGGKATGAGSSSSDVHVPHHDVSNSGGSATAALLASLDVEVLDIERIQEAPHVNKCKFCQACVPDSFLPSPNDQQATRQLSSAAAMGSFTAAFKHRSRLGPSQTNSATATATAAAGRLRDVRNVWAASNPATEVHARPGHSKIEGVEILQNRNANTTIQLGGETIDIAPGDMFYTGHDIIDQCSLCRGCKDVLEPMPQGTFMMGSYFAHEKGASPGWLFRVRAPGTRSGYAAVKVWCVPFKKAATKAYAKCKPAQIRRQIQLLLAQQRLTEECGLQDIMPRVWMDRVDGVIPGIGYHIHWHGAWSELAPGLSLENLAMRGKPALPREEVLKLLQERINRTQVLQAAMFDLLFSQCDRNPENMYITADGNIMSIDNDQAFGAAWRSCGVDSIFLPTTQKFEINRMGYHYVMKYPHDKPPLHPPRGISPLSVLDYRCMVPNGTIGTNYPPKLQQCMARLSEMSVDDIFQQYEYPAKIMAQAIKSRAQDMLTKGFEWTLLYGWPRNPDPLRYKLLKPCCTVRVSGIKYECDPAADPDQELPQGDPDFGKPWIQKSQAPDTGTWVASEHDPPGLVQYDDAAEDGL